MSEGSPQKAKSDEEEATEELERMYEELAQRKKTLSEQEMQKMMERLDQILTKLISKQKEIHDETIRLDNIKLNESDLPRSEMANLKKITQMQLELAKEVEKVNDKLIEEQSAVFFWILKTVMDEMILVKDLLDDESRTDIYTQQIQEDIIRKLKELLDALKKEKSRNKSGGQPPPGGGQQKPKLLPDIAELKMLRTMQENLMRKTEDFKKENIKENLQEFDAVQQKILQRLSAEQMHLADLISSFTKRLQNKEDKMEKNKEDMKH